MGTAKSDNKGGNGVRDLQEQGIENSFHDKRCDCGGNRRGLQKLSGGDGGRRGHGLLGNESEEEVPNCEGAQVKPKKVPEPEKPPKEEKEPPKEKEKPKVVTVCVVASLCPLLQSRL
ncbi:hypothetical protein K1719_012378 [Acacia pycnantha]|nr:hypothetical protein K1719_012378 [Acacia pycnantha]